MPRFVKRFLWALIASLAAHLALLLGPHISLPDNFAPPVTLEARLEPLPSLPPRQAKSPPRKPRHVPKRRTPRPRPAPAAPEAAPIATPDQAPVPPPPERAAREAPPAQPGEIPPGEIPPPMPRQATIRFTLYKGDNRLAVGKVIQTWKSDGKTYSVSQVAEASGVFSLFFSGRYVQRSEGLLTPEGLRPLSFLTERGQAAGKTDAAQFDWDAGTVAIKSGDDASTVSLPPGTQDLLSFVYQFAWSPPEDDVRLFITNGRKLDVYSYRALGEETLDTPLGSLKTLHLSRRHKTGEDGTDIWLAERYHYLPVKIRLTDKDGDAAEQVATQIQVTEQE
jgi:hypothetical protein